MSPTPASRRGIALALILGSQLMMTLDTSIITTALPHVQRQFGFSQSGLSWVQNAYVLAFGGLLLLGARAGDLLGRRRVFLAGITLFTAASLAAGLAQSGSWLITARVVQGLAAALAVPSTLALLVADHPQPGARARVIALYSAVIGAGGSVGIVIGGVFTDLLSWRWGMLVNVPIGIAIALLAPRFLVETERRAGTFDLGGALTSTGGMTALVYGFIQAAAAGWGAPATVVSLGLGAVLLTAFVLIEHRAPQPITPLRLFRSLERSGAYAGRILIVGATFSTFYFLSQYLQEVLHLSALQTGFAYVPITGMFFAMVYAIRPLQNRLGRPRPAGGVPRSRARRHGVAVAHLDRLQLLPGRAAAPAGDRNRPGHRHHPDDPGRRRRSRTAGRRRRVRPRQRRPPTRRLTRHRDPHHRVHPCQLRHRPDGGLPRGLHRRGRLLPFALALAVVVAVAGRRADRLAALPTPDRPRHPGREGCGERRARAAVDHLARCDLHGSGARGPASRPWAAGLTRCLWS